MSENNNFFCKDKPSVGGCVDMMLTSIFAKLEFIWLSRLYRISEFSSSHVLQIKIKNKAVFLYIFKLFKSFFVKFEIKLV